MIFNKIMRWIVNILLSKWKEYPTSQKWNVPRGSGVAKM